MRYEIKFSTQAAKFFRDLPQDLQERIRNKFHEISENPSRYVEHYEGDYNKIRIGKLRALVDVDNQKKILFVRTFDKRGRIYKR
ncbi:type II toxin-antitoxin system RelE/ParE family toxin [Candidatus Pacearchaeota archaeon]|nr:type II toxin-antitoxin system RelE/ParE family toxin [Candidatus Pacearchaeota archaeon]MBI2056843.1 type II toxin-antitoxin system RelE/ParE family toxin [Candidatus Pacearchaeota archaeon]